MDMRTDLIAVPHAGLGFHFLRVRVRTTEPRGLQEEIGPKSQDRRRRSSRHDDVRSGLPNVATCEVLGLASCHSEDSENGRYVWLIRPDIRMYCGRFVGPSLTAHGWSPCCKTKQMQKHPYDSKGDTHTHPPARARETNQKEARGEERRGEERQERARARGKSQKVMSCLFPQHFEREKE